jgi:ketosteroid isomerase-like protein
VAAPAAPEPTAPEPTAPEPAPPVAAPAAGFFADLVREWARVWALKDMEAYSAFYHPDFHYRAKNMDLAAFKEFRSGIMEEAGRLEVRVSDFEVQYWSGGRVRVAFRQDYRSDRLRDSGRKTLIFRKDGPDWKILSEIWRSN